jgi:hypothetical protein
MRKHPIIGSNAEYQTSFARTYPAGLTRSHASGWVIHSALLCVVIGVVTSVLLMTIVFLYNLR